MRKVNSWLCQMASVLPCIPHKKSKASTTSKGVHTRFPFPYSQSISPKMNTLQGRPFTDSDTTAANLHPHSQSKYSPHNTATPPAWESPPHGVSPPTAPASSGQSHSSPAPDPCRDNLTHIRGLPARHRYVVHGLRRRL